MIELAARCMRKIFNFLLRYLRGNSIKMPIVISKTGNYYLTRDLVITNPKLTAIAIKADNVSINLNGHVLRYLNSSECTSCGIESYGHSNITIKNGIIKNFMYGIKIQDTNLDKLENNSFDVMHNITIRNVKFKSNTFRGVYIQAKKVSINSSSFKLIGGTTVFPNSYAMAIEVFGQDCIIKNNFIENVYPLGIGEGIGISLSAFGDGGRIVNNSISSTFPPIYGRTFGIWIGEPYKNNIVVSHNRFENLSYGVGMNNLNCTLYNNTFNNIRCADYFGKERGYYLDKIPLYEEDTNYIASKAEKGDPVYLYKLGMQYLEGLWVDKDTETAYEYLTLAANLGHQESLRILRKNCIELD